MIRIIRSASVLVAFVLALTACASSDAEGTAPVQPIEQILASDIAIAFDPSATTATLTVETAVPVACSVVFGVDDSFGAIAVDNDMQGGAHNAQGPLLAGLVPETQYKYVLQGSDASGTLYRSDVMTFMTPPATDTGFGANIAAEATIRDFSSEFSDTFAAANAIDGNPATEWSTSGDGDAAWIELDLGQEEQVTAVAYRTRQMIDGSAITETFTITIDGTTHGPFPTGSEPIALDNSATGRIVRIDVDQTTGGNTGATEIEIYSTN